MKRPAAKCSINPFEVSNLPPANSKTCSTRPLDEWNNFRIRAIDYLPSVKSMKIEKGECVILILHSPREKLFGILNEINASGIFVRAIDLEYFDDWCASISAGEPYLPMSDYFIPMWRVERLTRDEGSGTVQSLSEQFEKRTGRAIGEF